ncbi:MAG: Stp1/IreP family PP2C-type Ser/Thr phosphatase [Peptococcaceae bacterium]|nr:Stp1/IreP family PP2C-type Ser/Thr phosphatase [Peptococcaceae bacterium]
MRFAAVGKTDIGLARKENQDNFLLLPTQGIYAVADGMGGHAGGRQASAIAIEALGQELSRLPALDRENVEAALARVNDRILTMAKELGLEGMGTTLVLAFYQAERWQVAHIGDSRAYAIEAAGIRALTQDHSVVSELLAHGSITPEAAKVHPHRNVLTRALGTPEDFQPDWNQAPAAAAYLLLCTDGLYKMVEEDEICRIVTAAGLSLEEKAGRLIEAAKDGGGLDNITAILIAGEESA